MTMTRLMPLVLAACLLGGPGTVSSEEPQASRGLDELIERLATDMDAGADKLVGKLRTRGLSEADAQRTKRQALRGILRCFMHAAVAADRELGAPEGELVELLWQVVDAEVPDGMVFDALTQEQMNAALERAEPCMMDVGQELGITEFMDD